MGPVDHLEIVGAKGGESQPKQAVESPDSLRSTNIAKILLAVGEGEFDGVPTDRDIYLDNTPIADASGNVNFPGVKWEWRPGSVEQSYIQGIPSVENETTVNVELRSDNPFTRALSNTQLSAIRVRMSWPRLARQDENGTFGYRIEYAIDVATDGGAFVESLLGAVDGKTTTGYQRSERVNLPKATSGWSFRVRRITPNATSDRIADTMMIAGYTEIIDQKIRYPNTALLYIEFDAQQFQNIPAVTVKCKAKRWPVPSTYDPITRAYSGVWDGTFKLAWTNNPAFVTYGLCVEDRFGLGKRIKPWMVDKWEMYRIAQYCDQLVPDGVGGQEPRFLCDINLQGRAEAWTLLRDLSAIYRGMVYWAQGSLFMQADMPRAQDIDYVFTRSNVIDGEFVYGGAERSTHYSRALVSYDNPANNYDTDVIPVTDNALQRRYRDRPIELSAIGCTRASEAQRRGKWALLSNSQDRTVTFKTGMEGRIPLPGFVIPVADELVAGRPNGGRISSAAGRVVTLDRDTPIKAGDRLIVNLPNGTAQARTVHSVAGRAVTVTTEYSLQPEPELQWAIDYDDLAVQLFRVLKTTRTQEGNYEITALEFNPSKFAAIDTGAKLDERPISVIPVTTVAPPASVSLSSGHMIDQGIAVSTMTIAWPAVAGAVAYDVEWRKDNGNWIRLQRTGAASVDVVGIYAGAYLARVRSVSAFDITSIWKSSNLTQLNGKEGLPPAVTFLTTESLLFGIGIRWGLPAGAEDTERTELWYSEGTDLGAATKLADLAYPQSEHVMQGLRAGQRFFFWARLVDRSGNVGPFFPVAPTVVSGVASADASPILEQIKDQITESELGKELTSKIEKITLIDGNGPGSVNERIGTAKTELAKQISDVNNALGTVKGNLEQQITAVSADVSAAKTELQQQIANVSALAGSLPYRKDKAYSVGQSALGSDGKLYQALKAVPLNTPPPNATYWTDVGQAVVTANGMAARVQTVETKVETLEGATSAQAQQISGLQSSLTTTNGNVSAAQQAAQDAATLAGGKGKVIVQSAAPAVADRLAQNLWIDTTGNANTPKRWSGSAWVAVTDKVATDAAAAAQSALSQVALKADASVVSNLSTRVSDAEGKLTSQATRMDGMQTSIDGKASSQALQQVTSRVTATEDKDKAQDQLISSQSQALTSLTDSVSKKADASTVQALSNEVKTQGQNQTAQGQALTRIDTKLLASQDNSPTKVYQSVFSDMAQDQWVSTNSGAGSSASFGTPTGITRGAALILDGGAGNRTWWGASTRKIRFDPTRLYKLTIRVQQVAMGTGSPGTYAGLDCYAEDGKTRVSTLGTGSVGSSHYVLLSNRKLGQGEWATAEVYVKGHTTGSEGGAAGAGTLADPKRLKEGAAWFSPMIIAGYSDVGGQVIVDYFDIEDATEQAQIDAGATATSAIGARVERTEQGLSSQSGAITVLINTLNATNQEVAKKADASTVRSLDNAVTQQGTLITANGQALTGISASLSNLGASGVNLVPAEYCAFTKDLPPMYSNGGVNVTTVADPQALKGYALRADSRAVDSHTFGLNTGFNAPGCNMDFKPGKYLVSFYARTETAGHMVGAYARVLLADGTSFKTSNAPTFALTTSWARYAGVIDLTDSAYTGTQMQLAIQGNRSGVANRVSYFDRFMFEAVVNEQKAPSTFSMGNSFDQAQANALANTALTGRVERAESGVTSVSGQLTELHNSIGDVGAENLVFNPSFERVDPGTPGMADGWWYDGTGSTTRVPSLVPSSLASGTAQRLDVTGLTSTTWARFYVKSQFRFKPVPGKTYTASVYMRGTAGLRILPQVYGTNEAGAGTESWAAARTDATDGWVRLTVTFTPGAATTKIYAAVVVYGGGSANSGFIEADRYQIEEGVRATGWRDNGQVNSFESSALSSAVTGLSSTVSQQGSNLSSVSSRTTNLENAVNSTSSGLPSKASTSALQSLTGRVTAAEGGLTAANSSITRIGSQVEAIGGSGSNLMPAEYSTFTDSLPVFRSQSGLVFSAVADAAAYSGRLLKVESNSGSGWTWLASSPTDYNLRLVTGRQYIVSFWSKGSAVHNVAVRMRFQNVAGGESEVVFVNVNVGLELARYSGVFTAPAALAGPACVVLFTQSAGNSGATWFDGFMVEEKIGESTAPSAFTPGTSTRQAAGQALAVSALDTKVTQQGAKIESEAKRTDGLYTSVGNANSAIQDETTARASADSALSTRINTAQAKANEAAAAVQSEVQARADADGALSKRVDTAQATAGNANAAAQQVATAQSDMKGMLNAQYTMRVQINNQMGVHHWGGFGIGINEQNGVVQSAFVVYSDQFVLLNANGGGLSSPFSVVGGQTFISDAYIRNASIGTAKIANGAIANAQIQDAAITNSKIGNLQVDTLKIGNEAVTIPRYAGYAPRFNCNGSWQTPLTITFYMPQPGMVYINYCSTFLSNGTQFYQYRLVLDGNMIAESVANWSDSSITLASGQYVGAGQHTVDFSILGAVGVVLSYQNLMVQGIMR
ncbi:TipJ family phage tail tip protein [Pseudomonas parafulva]|uniref:TipJ family phage tail tip protein n=1 Tax=Pseudomonas parafulva TaxID=157782 RepID=UPI0009C0C426